MDEKTLPPWQRPKIAIILSILKGKITAIDTTNNQIRKVESNEAEQI